jgi:hypothetical protein
MEANGGMFCRSASITIKSEDARGERSHDRPGRSRNIGIATRVAGAKLEL